MEPPKVFASYSHDSDDHKQWVLKLCTKLVENGVDVMLDQWDIRLGTDQALFMEKLGAADRVLVICTDSLLLRNSALPELWMRLNVTQEQMETHGVIGFTVVEFG